MVAAEVASECLRRAAFLFQNLHLFAKTKDEWRLVTTIAVNNFTRFKVQNACKGCYEHLPGVSP